MSNKFSDLQRDKNGVTPQMIISDLTEHVQKNDVRGISISFVDKDGYNHVRNWAKGEDDELRINQNLLISATGFADLAVKGVLFNDMDEE